MTPLGWATNPESFYKSIKEVPNMLLTNVD